MRTRVIVVLLAAAAGLAAVGAAAPEDEGRVLIQRLGCPVCHDIPGHTTTVRQEAPDLTWEGDRVQADWLFAFLKAPHTIRPAVAARMPNFRLTDEEALALTEALRGFKDRAAKPLAPAQQFKGAVTPAARDAAQKLTTKDYFDCFSCHWDGDRKPAGKQEEWGPDLGRVPQRLQPDWIVRWLTDPSKLVANTKMPAFFADDKSGPDDILGGDEMAQMMALRDWLVTRSKRNGDAAYDAARTESPEAGPTLGRSLLVRLNCVGCHRIAGFPEGRRVGPHLGFQGTRVNREWLREFLRRPGLIKPEYAIMGSDARMPDFRLSDREVDVLVEYIATKLVDPKVVPVAAGMFDRKLVPDGERLFAEKFCDNCHRIERRPGGIGPDLTFAGRRLNPAWIYRFVLNPSHYLDTRMPNLKLTEPEARAVTAFLLHRESTP